MGFFSTLITIKKLSKVLERIDEGKLKVAVKQQSFWKGLIGVILVYVTNFIESDFTKAEVFQFVQFAFDSMEDHDEPKELKQPEGQAEEPDPID